MDPKAVVTPVTALKTSDLRLGGPDTGTRIIITGIGLLIPIVVVVCSRFPLYNPVGYLDPWFYTGYFNNLSNLYQWFGPTYYFSRLPWIAPGYIAYHVLPAKWAYFALHATFLYSGCLLLYLLLRYRYDHYVAMVGVALLAANPLFLRSQSWEYVDGAGIVYVLGGMYFLDRSRHDNFRLPALLISGTCWTLAVNCNIVFVIIAGSYIAASIYKRQVAARALPDLISMAVGSAISLFALGVLNHLLTGGDYLFFAKQLSTARSLLASGELANYKVPLFDLIKTEYRVLVPFVLLIIAVIVLYLHKRSRSTVEETNGNRELIRDSLFVLLSFGALLVWEFAAHGVALEMTFYFSYMVPGIVLLASGLIDRWSRNRTGEASRNWLWATAVISAALVPSILGRVTSVHGTVAVLALPYCAAVLLVICAATMRNRSVLVCMLLTLYTISSFTLSASMRNYLSRDTSSNRAAQLGGIKLIAHLSREIPEDSRFLFWYAQDQPASQEFDSITSLYLWRRSSLGTSMPVLNVKALEDIAAAKTPFLVMLAKNSDQFAGGLQALAARGLEPHTVDQETIAEPGFAFQYLIVRLGNMPAAAGDMVGRVEVNHGRWPETLRMEEGRFAGEVYRLSGSGVREIFRSRMDAQEGLQVNRYGRAGGLQTVSGCLDSTDTCGRYATDDARDHIATLFVPVSGGGKQLVFFSVWVKPLDRGILPVVFLQSNTYTRLAEACLLSRRADGWNLLGGWAPAPAAQSVRVVITQRAGAASMLEDMYLVNASPVAGQRASGIAAQ